MGCYSCGTKQTTTAFIVTMVSILVYNLFIKERHKDKPRCLFDLIRRSVLQMNYKVGIISQYFDDHYNMVGDDIEPKFDRKDLRMLRMTFSSIVSTVIFITASMGYNLQDCIEIKMKLNEEKYIKKLVMGEDNVDQKPNKYNDINGVSNKIGQTLFRSNEKVDNLTQPKPIEINSCLLYINLGAIFNKSYIFAKERKWDVHDKPVNLTLALIGEIAELGELYTWKKKDIPTINRDKIDKTLQEFADITIYVLRLAHTCGIEPSSLSILNTQ